MKQYFIIFLLVATELIGFGLIIPILPQISKQFTSSGFLLGVLLSSYSFAQFFAAPFLGQLSDKYGRKPILIFSKIGTIISYIILAGTASYHWLLVSRCLDGFTGGNIAVARAYLSDITAEENRSKAMAIIGLAFGTGFIIGPAIGGICYNIANNFSVAGYVGAGLSFTSLCLTQFFLKEPTEKLMIKQLKFRKNMSLVSKESLYFLLIYLTSMIVFSGFETSFSIYTESKFGFNESNNSMLFFVIGIVAFIIQGSFTKFEIKPINKAISIAFICIGFSLIGSNLLESLIPSLAVLMFLLFGIAIINTHLPAELSKISPNKGFILGLYESVGSIARIIGPLIIFTSLFNYIDILYIILGSITIAFLICLQVVRKTTF
tara:strand:+ start:871 stop:2001 length:1131 start_codon:yes stop_codon:yes gene_type:complete